MNHDFEEDGAGRSRARKSRKKPSMRENHGELNGGQDNLTPRFDEGDDWGTSLPYESNFAQQDRGGRLGADGLGQSGPENSYSKSSGRRTERTPRPDRAPGERANSRVDGKSAASGSGGHIKLMDGHYDSVKPLTGSESGALRTRAAAGRQNSSSMLGGKQSAVTQTAFVPGARGKMRTEKSRRRKRIIALIVAECFALFFIFGYAFAAKRWNMIQRPSFNTGNVKNNELAEATVEKMKGYWTIAIFGVDARDKTIVKDTNADVIMICNINQDTGEIRLVSVFRDSYLNISDDNTYNKINQAYFIGGPEQAVKALNKNLDLNITDYVTFNWKAVADAINILGGVDIDITKREFSDINSFITETQKATKIPTKQLKKAGMNHLDGVQAVAYGRLRLMDTDYARTERQRKILAQCFDKAKQADWAVLNNIMVTVFPQVATSVDAQDVISSARNITKYHLGETSGFPFNKGEVTMGKKGACVIPQTLVSNVQELHKFLFDEEDYSPTDTVKTISAKISSDSGRYSDGKSSGGNSSKNKNSDNKKTEESRTEESSKKETLESETESSSAGRPGGDSSGWEPWATDEFGNPVDPAWGEGEYGPGQTGAAGPGGTRPGTTKPDATKPDSTKLGEIKPEETLPTDENTGPAATLPGQTSAPETTMPNKPGSTQAPTGTTTPETTGAVIVSPGPTTSAADFPGTAGPGENSGPGM